MLDFNKIQDKWQKAWEKLGEVEPSNKKKFFMIFAYPGISGFMHVGHMRGYSYTDAICRFKRMNGFNVMFPVGTHASGNQAMAFAKKVQNNDADWINYLKNNGCPSSLIPKLTTPESVVGYFNQVYIEEYWKKFGFIADWRRFTCTIYPDYNKFIQWQFKKLNDNNLLIQKPYFATACTECGPVAVDPSETDISKGGNAEKNEYVLLKFKFGDDYIVAATLRPETVYGQTNLWVNPKVKYVKADVGDEVWIMSSQAAEKLSYQKDSVKVFSEVDGKELIGKFASAPVIEKEIIILPSEFPDPNVGSGIVTSVPSDAPWDYIALRDLQHNEEECRKYGLDINKVNEIKLIPIIKSKGYGDFPGKEIVEKLNIKSQNDHEKLEEATKEIYKAGFHTGIMRDNCGEFSGKNVEEAKELMKQNMLDNKQADIIQDLSEEVICRCGNKVIIKRIDDQWFIKYSDSELTNKSKEHAKSMTILPKEYYNNVDSVLDWFSDRACARLGNWLGTKLPFDDKWTIEPISDSTLYPAYYIVSKYINDGTIDTENLTEEFFDYIFLGKGEIRYVSNKTKVSPETLQTIHDDFIYWYPLDVNLGGKEHKTVHFPVFVMNHVAILNPEHWPKGIFVNWWVTGKGTKISKSKGGAVPVPGAIEQFGVDSMRLYYANVGSPHLDVVWEENVVYHYKNALERCYSLFIDLLDCEDTEKKLIDDWLVSRTNERIKCVTSHLDQFNLRDASTLTYFNFYEDLKWYLRRGGSNGYAVKDALEAWVKLMTPTTPHLAEELWSKLGKTDLVSDSSWPSFDEQKINYRLEAVEDMINQTLDDTRKVIQLAKVNKPNKITLFIAQDWLYNLFSVLKKELEVTRNMGEIIRTIMQHEEFKQFGKDVSKLVMSIAKDPSKLPLIVTSQEQEFIALQEAKPFLEKEFRSDIDIILAESSHEQKAKQAMPGKPAILVN